MFFDITSFLRYPHRLAIREETTMTKPNRSANSSLLPTHGSRGSSPLSPTANLASEAGKLRALFRLGKDRATTGMHETARDATSFGVDRRDQAYHVNADMYRDLESFNSILADTDISANPDNLRSRFHKAAALRDKVASSVKQLPKQEKTAYQTLIYSILGASVPGVRLPLISTGRWIRQHAGDCR